MKKLDKYIIYTKSILAFSIGLLIAGCSAEDELGTSSTGQQLDFVPMINDLQNTRVAAEEGLHEKDLFSLDFKMFDSNNNKHIDKQIVNPEEGKAEKIGDGNWKDEFKLETGKNYCYYAVANGNDLKGKSLNELLTATMHDDNIWKTYLKESDKKFLMSSMGNYTIGQEETQTIPVELVRAAAKIKLNIISTVSGYDIKDVKWKFANYNTNTSVFAGQTATPNITSNTASNEAQLIEANKYAVTTYSYATTWTGKDDAPQIIAEITFVNKDDKSKEVTKTYNIPVRDPQEDKKLERNYIYTINANIKYLDTETHIDYNKDLGYLKWAITKWTQGEDTYVNAGKTSYLVVSPTVISIKGFDNNETQDKTIQWFASDMCNIRKPKAYYLDKEGKEIGQDQGQIDCRFNNNKTDSKRGWVDIHAGMPQYPTIVYCTFYVGVQNQNDVEQYVVAKKYPSIYSMNVLSSSDSGNGGSLSKRLYTVQFSTNKTAQNINIAQPTINGNGLSTDNTVSPALIIGSSWHSTVSTVDCNEKAKEYCKKYSETATTKKNESLALNGWRLPTKEEIKQIIELQKNNQVIDKDLLQGEYYWTLDGGKSEQRSNTSFKGEYVRCVHDLTSEEIEKIEEQGIK